MSEAAEMALKDTSENVCCGKNLEHNHQNAFFES